MGKNEQKSTETVEMETVSELSFTDTFQVSKDTKFRFKNLGEKFTEISKFYYDYLKQYNLPSAYRKSDEKTVLQMEPYKPLPFKVTVCNAADKQIAKHFGLKEFEPLPAPVTLLKSVNKGTELVINESHLLAFEIVSANDIKMMNRMVSKINAVLKSFFERRNALRAECNCSFGMVEDKLLLTGDFTPMSIKVISGDGEKTDINPFALKSSQHLKSYTEFLLTFVTG
jgi:phosphoribosylaminoimidazole-succinocarboxamide synthase